MIIIAWIILGICSWIHFFKTNNGDLLQFDWIDLCVALVTVALWPVYLIFVYIDYRKKKKIPMSKRFK